MAAFLRHSTTFRLFAGEVEREIEVTVKYSYFPGKRPSIIDEAEPAAVEIHTVRVSGPTGGHDLMPLLIKEQFEALEKEILEVNHG